MTTRTRALIALPLVSFLALAPQPGRAQSVNLAHVQPGSAWLRTSFGLDPALVTTVAYSRAFALAGRTALWDVDLGIPVADADLEDMRARVGVQSTVWQMGSWHVAGHGRLIARRTSNTVYDGAGFAADLTASIGIFRQGWFAAGLVGHDRTLVMHILHSNWYRENVYGGAVDGWYRGRSGISHGGLAAGLTLRAIEIVARLEWRRLDGGEALDPPLVGGLSLSRSFGRGGT